MTEPTRAAAAAHQASSCGEVLAPPVGNVSRPSVNAWTTTSGTPQRRRHARPAPRRGARDECTPPSLTRPMRCTRSAPANAARSTSLRRERAVGDRLVDARQVLADDRAGAEVEVADLGVAHLPVGQPDGRAAGASAACAGSAPRGRRRPACPRARPRCPAPAARAPSRRGRRGRRRTRGHAAAADDRGEGLRVERGAADEPAVAVGQREQLGGVVGLHRAAVEDPDVAAACVLRAVGDQRAAEGERLLACSGVATLPVPIAQIGS